MASGRTIASLYQLLNNMKTVFKSTNRMAVQQRKVFLENADIQCNILNEGTNAAYGELPAVDVELVVLDAQKIKEAYALLAEYEAGISGDGSLWRCSLCGESSEPQFSECWKCGESRPLD